MATERRAENMEAEIIEAPSQVVYIQMVPAKRDPKTKKMRRGKSTSITVTGADVAAVMKRVKEAFAS
jgi:hypothetical protein